MKYKLNPAYKKAKKIRFLLSKDSFKTIRIGPPPVRFKLGVK